VLTTIVTVEGMYRIGRSVIGTSHVLRRSQSGDGSIAMRETPDSEAESFYKGRFATSAKAFQSHHACHFHEQAVSHRTLPHRARPLRHQANQEGHPDHPLFRADA